MQLQQAILTIFYFFPYMGDIETRSWFHHFVERLLIKQQPRQRNVWRNESGSRLVDLEQSEDVSLIRVSLQDEKCGSVHLWQRLLKQYTHEHDIALGSEKRKPCFGCSMVYWGTSVETALVNLDTMWLASIPVEEALPSPQSVSLRCASLWQLQNGQPEQPQEIIYGMLTTPDNKDAVYAQLIYHPAFWHAEAIRHQMNQQWHKWLYKWQVEGTLIVSRLRGNLQQLLKAETPIAATELTELGHCYADFQQYSAKTMTLQRQIVDAQQRYSELMNNLCVVKETSDLVTAVLYQWQQALTQLQLAEQINKQINDQLNSTLHYQSILQVANEIERMQ